MDVNINSDSGVTPYFSNVSGHSVPAIIRSAESLGLNPTNKLFSLPQSPLPPEIGVPLKPFSLLGQAQPEEASFYIANKIDEHVKSKNGVGLGMVRVVQNVVSLRERFSQSHLSVGRCMSGLYLLPLDVGNYHLGTFMASTEICRVGNDKDGAASFVIPHPNASFSLKYVPVSRVGRRGITGMERASLKPIMM